MLLRCGKLYPQADHVTFNELPTCSTRPHPAARPPARKLGPRLRTLGTTLIDFHFAFVLVRWSRMLDRRIKKPGVM
jgi:hypothetical protein